MNTIVILQQSGQWVAISSNPLWRDLMGTDIVPTPFTTATPYLKVLSELKRLNPDCAVVRYHKPL